ncbi:MAG: ATP-binding protein [Planctomycetota bacterium]
MKPELGAASEPERASSSAKAREFAPWYPTWANQLGELYFSGTTSAFIVHGNVFDPVRVEGGTGLRYLHLAGFLAEQLFGGWDLVFHYDLAGGLRVLAGADGERLKEMRAEVQRKFGDLTQVPRDPGSALAFVDRVVQRNLTARDGERSSVAVIVSHASYVVPSGEPGHLSLAASTNLVTILNWATSPYVKRVNMAFVLVDPKLSAVNERLAANPHVAALEAELPGTSARAAFIDFTLHGHDLASFSDYPPQELAKLTAGVSLSDLETLVHAAREGGRRLDAESFRALKKRLIERQCEGFLEFIEPSWNLDMVVGHEAAKSRLRDDAELMRKGHLESVPMGYLVCGPVGTGKSFLAQCATGSIGVPCVVLKNFRSKYVGETEGNLEKVLSVLRAMGPVVVIVDEADAMLGNREQDGDSGTSGRVFAMIASQMGNTRYRGRIIWMLLTCRPDLLPIDIKRQGRAEVHIPMFYPSEEAELKQLFVVLGRKLGAKVAAEDIPPIPHLGDLSGADVEGIVGRAQRTALLAGADRITREILLEALNEFMPSTQSLERELQEIAAIIECTDRRFLSASILERIDRAGGRPKLQERLTALKHLVEAQ